MKPILEIQDIGKKFRIDHRAAPYLSLREKLVNSFRPSSRKEDFWALRDVSFNVSAGDSIGIIGRNGAGKSTLLKILSRITPPTRGRIVSRGRIASLLEVGTGFHQELTGRENIFLNGSILGMRRAEVVAKFDEIVDFAGTERFLDTPLKHYSSGMQLRLAFAVAAFLEPEILIIDEVLAVGDAEFQKKCIGRMEETNRRGRTILFVSHNLPTLRAICKTGILLKEGRVANEGLIDEVIDSYSAHNAEAVPIADGIDYFGSDIKVHNLTINQSDTGSISASNGRLEIELEITLEKPMAFELELHVKQKDILVASYADFVFRTGQRFSKGKYMIHYEIQLPEMRSGKYKIDLYFAEAFVRWLAVHEDRINLELFNPRHHTHLNTPALTWSPVLMEGSVQVARKDE